MQVGIAIRRTAVIANRQKPIALQTRAKVVEFLKERGIKVSPFEPQLVITVGGDGTVLFSKKYYGIPFFSIGSKTSFICQADFSNWKSRLSEALACGKKDRRLLLEARLNGKPLPLVLNEVGIRNPQPRLLSIYIGCKGRHFAFRADGAFFSTPTGSPAYAYSCGGKQMPKNSLGFQAVAISPFRRLFKPQIIRGNAACTLRISGKERAQLFLDGQKAGTFTQKDALVVKPAKKRFYFLSA